MQVRLSAAVDRRLSQLIVARLRRNWPLLELVPSSLMSPIVTPIARKARRSLYRGAAAAVVPVGSLIMLVALIASL